jgi:hypothetical protein
VQQLVGLTSVTEALAWQDAPSTTVTETVMADRDVILCETGNGILMTIGVLPVSILTV